jgi:hypothetical protein
MNNKEVEFVPTGTPNYYQVYQTVGDGHRSNTHLGDLDLDGGAWWFGRHYTEKQVSEADKFAYGLTLAQMKEIVEFAEQQKRV